MIYFNSICFIATAAAFIIYRNYRRMDVKMLWPETKQAGISFGLPLRMYDLYKKLLGYSHKTAAVSKVQSQLHKLMPLCSISEAEDKLYAGMIRIFLTMWMLVHFLAIIFTLTVKETVFCDDGSLIRPDAGAPSYTVEMDMNSSVTGKSKIDVTVSPKLYTDKEREAVFLQAKAYVLETALGDNEAWENICYPLNFIKAVPGTGILVEWTIDDYALLDDSGNIMDKAVSDAGERTFVTVKLVYEAVSETFDIPMTIFPTPVTDKEKFLNAVESKLAEADRGERNKDRLVLPDNADGKAISWSVPKKNTAAAVTMIGILAALLCAAGRVGDIQTKLKEREQQLVLDYPDFVYKLVLLNGAGMNLKSAMETMLGDAKIAGRDGRYVWQEVQAALRAMAQGVSEKQAYELFGQRCAQLPYLKLGSLMVQSLKKGVGGIGHMMSDAADEAVMMKKNAAVKAGEAVGTKLLMPMGLLLAVVLIILIVPAFMTMNM